MTLLVVDPDDSTSSALSDTLSHLGFSCYGLRELPTWRAWLSRQRPELVLCPYRIDQPNPLGLVDGIPRQDPTLPVALVSRAELARPALLAALRLGVVEVIEIEQSDRSMARLIDAAIGRGARIAAPARRLRSRCPHPRATARVPARPTCRDVTSRWGCCRRVRWQSIATG